MRLLMLFRQTRATELEQLVGLLMLAGAFTLAWRPYTQSLTWLAALWDAPALTTVFVLLLGGAGFVLALCVNACAVTFAALTAPLVFYAALTLTYALATDMPIFGAGMFGAFWIALQFAHSQQREVRQWTKPSASS